MPFEIADEEVQHQYELLNILDAKASALLSFNALALAVITIWLSYIPLNYLHMLLDLLFVALLVSCGSLLRIVWIRWASPDDSAENLDEVRLQRTRHYRLAWRLATYSVVALVLASVVHMFGTALSVFELCGQTCERFYSEDVFGNLDYSE